jgi:hypothetical protein
LSFDPPVRHTRVDYAGNRMGFHLLRGTTAQEVFDAFRKWEKEEGDASTIDAGLKCDVKPGSQRRERGSQSRLLQANSFEDQILADDRSRHAAVSESVRPRPG